MNFNIEEVDLTLAIQLQAQFKEELRVQKVKDEEKQKSLQTVGHKWNAKWMSLPEPEQERLSVSLVDPCWEYLDPTPNIYELFLTFNHQFFWGRLMGVEVKWSPRMTVCAGVCSYEGRGGLCSVRLSTPLLKLRPRKDLIETLLHEMIHAYLFVTHNNTDHDGHGPQFHKHMYRINKLAGTSISVYHSFHDEVNVYKQHIWQCDGPCRKRPPYFGLVKRSINRPPSQLDFWWKKHVETCGGSYTKIREPEGYGQPKSKRKVKDESSKDIRNFFPVSETKKTKSSSEIKEKNSGKVLGRPTNNNYESTKTGNKFPNGNIPTGVNRLDIKNASNSSVHGFNSGGPVSWSSSSGGFRAPSNRSSTSVRTSGGSKTFVVGKNKKVDPSKKEESISKPGESFASFSGNGHKLGTSSAIGKSRLLTQFDNYNKNKSSEDRESEFSCNVRKENDKFLDDFTLCPLCQIRVNSDDFENHVADCLGDIDFNSDLESSTNSYSSSTDKQNTSNPIKEELIFISDDECPPPSVDKYFPCPVCGENFKECDINVHVNGHFN